MNTNELKKKNVLILGAGKTGIATANCLINKAKNVLLSESNTTNNIRPLVKPEVEIELGQNSDNFINRADLVVISPGISPYSEVVKKLNLKNIPIISDIEIAKLYIQKPIIAVTGTNGKTTTTSLITHIINSSGKKAISCGNIGKPLIELVNENTDYFVLEISSFQIYYSQTLACDIAVCLNITPDHLDWHGSFEHYVQAKKNLFTQQNKNSWAVLNYNDNHIKEFNPPNNIFYFSYVMPDKNTFEKLENFAYYKDSKLLIKQKNEISEIACSNDLQIIGNHNIENALASISAAKILNIKAETMNFGLKGFKGVEHRLEYVKNINHKEFYNDSKATNPEATIKAIEALNNKKNKKITLILGGRDKNTNLNEMISSIKSCVSEVILYGEAKERFKKEFDRNNYKKIKIVQNLPEAVTISSKSESDIVLFSPACSSFDMFKNYEERGNIFKALVSKL